MTRRTVIGRLIAGVGIGLTWPVLEGPSVPLGHPVSNPNNQDYHTNTASLVLHLLDGSVYEFTNVPVTPIGDGKLSMENCSVTMPDDCTVTRVVSKWRFFGQWHDFEHDFNPVFVGRSSSLTLIGAFLTIKPLSTWEKARYKGQLL